jgi:hypothetical protein
VAGCIIPGWFTGVATAGLILAALGLAIEAGITATHVPDVITVATGANDDCRAATVVTTGLRAAVKWRLRGLTLEAAFVAALMLAGLVAGIASYF